MTIMDTTETQVQLLTLAINARVPVLLWGSPGVGKSSVIAAIFRELRWPLEIILSAIRDPTDFGGFPVAETKKDRQGNGYTVMSMLPTAWAQRLSKREIGERPAGLFLEEINQAPPSVQAALMRVVLDGFVGDEELGPNVARIAAANPPEQSAGGWNLAAPLANRFFHLDWSLSPDYWAKGLVAGFPAPHVFTLPKDWESDYIPATYGLVSAYIQGHGSSMLDVPKDESKASLPWPSPRSWTMGARMMAAAQSIGASEGTMFECLKGCIGVAGATMYIEWKSKLDLPSAEEMLKNPKKVKWPTNRGDKTFAMLTTAAAHAINKKDPKIWHKGWELVACAADAGYKDVAAIAGKNLATNRPSGADVPEECAIFFEAYELAGMVKR